MKTQAEYCKEWRRKNYKRWRAIQAMSQRQSRYGIDILTITRKTPDGCEVCGENDNRGLSCDHDHDTGRFRGWLCCKCNQVLGFLEKDPSLNQRLIEYKLRETANNAGIRLTREEFNRLHELDK